ncbi:MAG: radical SAM protein [Candidatus Liptonbacteria bacterium]|nr:radical SAM protein [Candidatus Liptonbacteria bacterium]
MKILERVSPPGGIATKYLQETNDGFVVEATYIRRPEKHTLCVSTQVGCPIGCRFCASGRRSKGSLYQRSLTSAEMVEECCNIAQEMDFAAHCRPLTFAFMGEGEPFLNFDECLKAFYALAAMSWPVPMQLAVSTSGIRPDLIRRLGEITFSVRLKLHVSLHGPSDDIRFQIMPVTQPISEIVAAVRAYRERCGRPVVWNYVLCAGVNDRLEHAEQIVRLLGPGWHVKFTRLNPAVGSPFRPTPRERVEQFRRILEEGGLSAAYTETDESGIQAGCGQLSYHYARGGRHGDT